MTGLIGRGDFFLYIPRCTAVHTWFMRGPIDVVFLDARSVVVAIRESVPPWRIALGPRGARSVLELPDGHARERGLATGDTLTIPE
jgi:uncharacterized protein